MKSNFLNNKKYKALRHWLILPLFFFSLTTSAQIGDIKQLTPRIPFHYEITDLDNDGDWDVVCQSPDIDRKLYWYENNSTNILDWPIHTIEVPDPFTQFGEIKVADFNGDGWQDIFQINSYVFLSNGDAPNLTFTPIAITDINPGSRGITGDFDGDGDIDLFRWTTNTGPNNFTYENINQDGTFGPPQAVDLPPPFTDAGIIDAKFFDLDSDNDLDIITSISGSAIGDSSFVYWYENTDGQGTFEIADIIHRQSSEGRNPYLAVGHFDSDNTPDIISANRSGLYIHEQGMAGWETTRIDSADYSYFIDAADFDNDGDLDIVEGKNFDQVSYWFENINNSGVFVKDTLLASDSIILYGNLRFESSSDFDNDGDIDLLGIRTSSYESDGLFFFENDLNASGTFQPAIKFSDNIQGYSIPLSFDIELDGDNDVIAFSRIEQAVYLLENIDNNEFAYQYPLWLEDQITSINHVDLDADGDQDILAINEAEELVWYENLSNGSVQFSEKKVLGTGNYIYSDIVTGDLDEDGDIDISTIQTNGRTLALYEHMTLDDFTYHMVANDSIASIGGIADLDQDGLNDIITAKDIGIYSTEIAYFQQNTSTDFSYIPIDSINSFRKLVVDDINNDLAPDLVILQFSSFIQIAVLFNEIGSFNEYLIEYFDPFLIGFDLAVYDLDNDGKKDIFYDDSWFKQLPNSSFSEGIFLTHDINGYLLVNDLNGDNYGDFIYSSSDHDPLICAESLIGEATIITGQAFLDVDQDCELDVATDTMGLPNLIIEFQRDNETFYTNSNSEGYYALVLPEGYDYLASINTPNAYWSPCFEDTLLSNLPGDTTINLDFPVIAEVDCPLMTIDLNVGPLRPCLDGAVYFQYCNDGTQIAENAVVELLIAPNIIVNFANFPFTETDTSLLFELGNVDVLECENIVLSVTPDCDSIEIGDLVCFDVHVTPDSLCMPLDSLWDGSTIAVNGNCIGDSIHFNLQNIGDGAMSSERQFRIEIVNDDIVLLIQVDTFQLDPEETKTIVVEAEMDVLRLEADQDENHPFLNTASTTVTECSDFEFFWNFLPDDSGNPFEDTHCQDITGSFDPNIKEAVPLGYSDEHLIDKSWELEYTIHFQNTGNDTAFRVVVVDPISEYLNLATLRMGTSSHPFTWQLNPQRELSFTFENILLPDSMTNEVGSQGFVQFFIYPQDTLMPGTSISNRAAIYFDFNEPIITEPVIRTIRTPIFANSAHITLCEQDFVEDIQIFNDTLIVDSTLTSEGLFLDFLYVTIIPITQTQVDTMIPYGTIFNNIPITQDTIIETVELSANGCDSLISYSISILTNTNELEQKYQLQVAPIPTEDAVLIGWNTAPQLLSLYTIEGQLLQIIRIENDPPAYNLNLSNYPAGVYHLKINFTEGPVYRKLIKL